MKIDNTREAGNQQSKPLSEICQLLRGGSLSKSDLIPDGKNLAIHYGELFTRYGDITNEVISKTNVNGRMTEAGDILMPTSDVTPDGLGCATAVMVSGVVIGGDINVIRSEGEVDPEYLTYWIRANRSKFIERVTGTTVKHLYLKDIQGLTVTYPSLLEQRRIADALSAIDAKIDLLTRKRDNLTRFKAGLMQKIFSQEVRFTREDGSAYPDWEENKIQDLLTICYGKDHKHLGDGDVPVYGTGGLMRQADTSLHTGPSILIGRKGTIDKPRYVEGPFWTVDTVFYTKIKEGNDPFLLFSVLQTVEWLALNEASGVPSLNAKTVGSVLVTIPTDICEQRQISAVLKACDEKIEAGSQQIVNMQSFKKGLLQQMFV